MSRSWANIEKKLREAERSREEAKNRRPMTLTLYKRNGEVESCQVNGIIDETAMVIEFYLAFLDGDHGPDEVVRIRNETTGDVSDFERAVEEVDAEEQAFQEWLERQGYVAKEIFSDEWE